MIENAYAKFLLADRIQKAALRAGTTVVSLTFRNGFGEVRAHSTHDVAVMLDTIYSRHDGDSREEVVDRFLTELPFLSIQRTNGEIYLYGMDHNGLRVGASCGTGACERVQVGTKTVKQPDPEALALVPMVDVEVPIFEVRCVDPLNELVKS